MAQMRSSRDTTPADSAGAHIGLTTAATSQSANDADRTRALCDRVQTIAREAGEQSLQQMQRQAETLVDQARSRAAAEASEQLSRTEQQLQKQVGCELQNARLQARARQSNFQWSQLDSVLDQAEREVERLREIDNQRYRKALLRFWHAARNQLPDGQLIVRAGAKDIRWLRDHLQSGEQIDEIIEDDIASGLVVSTADGNIVCDQTIRRRLQRQEAELRLVAAETLFGEQADRPPCEQQA